MLLATSKEILPSSFSTNPLPLYLLLLTNWPRSIFIGEWGITADGYVAFANDAELLKGACGKSLASFPQGCFFSTAHGELRSYENPKNKDHGCSSSRRRNMWSKVHGKSKFVLYWFTCLLGT